MATDVTASPDSAVLSDREWHDLRNRLVEVVAVSDGEYDYQFRCETPTERWRARTLLDKEEGTVDWIRREVHSGDVFYDIGANIGMYSLMAARRAGRQGRVYAFEPHMANVHSLLHNVGLNGVAEWVKVFSCALNDREGFFDFNYFAPGAGSSMSQLDETRDASGTAFRPCFSELKYATTIDRLIQQGAILPADHVKMDVDGNELLILRGMWEYLAGPRAPRSVQIEINTRYRDQIYEFMNVLGYTSVERHDTHLGKQALQRGEDPESIGYNAVFRRP